MTDVNIGGILGIAAFYVLILVIGIWAGWYKRKSGSEDPILLGRSLGYFVAASTISATWIGGAHLYAMAEYVNTPGRGMAWAQLGWAYTGSLLLGTLIVKIMRERNYKTLLDPFQERYGTYFGALLLLPHFLGELAWAASVLAPLGDTLSVVAGFNRTATIVVSAAIAVLYTLFGGLLSVAYTDIVQMACVFIGVWLSVPFILTDSAVGNISDSKDKWLGTIQPGMTAVWIDVFLQIMLGALPVQEIWQRVLACKTTTVSICALLTAAAVSVIFCAPSILIGAAAATADWTQTDLNQTSIVPYLTLPMSLQYLTPEAVAYIGLGAIAAAIMSSTDSIFLASGNLLTRNIYHKVFRPKASKSELKLVLRAFIFLVAALGSLMAIYAVSVYKILVWSTDMMYVIMFPQFFAVLFLTKYVNTYGALPGYCVGLTLRLLAGEPGLIDPVIKYWYFVEELKLQRFPFRTFTMLCSLVTIILGSCIANFLFKKRILPIWLDTFRCFDELRSSTTANGIEVKGSRDNLKGSRDNKGMSNTDEPRDSTGWRDMNGSGDNNAISNTDEPHDLTGWRDMKGSRDNRGMEANGIVLDTKF